MKKTKKDGTYFAKVMYGLAGNFGGKISEDDITLRFTALIEYHIKEIKLAGTWLLKHRENTFPAIPTTKEIIDAIGKIRGELEKKNVAMLEADKILKLLRQWGRECGTRFKDPVTDYLMTCRWNFQYLGGLNEKDLNWWKKDFIQAYEETEKDKDQYLDVAEKAGLIPENPIPVSNLTKLIGDK